MLRVILPLDVESKLRNSWKLRIQHRLFGEGKGEGGTGGLGARGEGWPRSANLHS